MVLVGIFIAVATVIGLFIWYLSFSSTNDLSEDIRFKDYLNKPIVVKQSFALKKNTENMNRFKAYFLESFIDDSTNRDQRLQKKYDLGDTIIFTAAKGYYSNHVGNTYYLLGKEKLDSGEVIEFEYYASFDYSPAIWETMDEFLQRRKLESE